MARPYYTDSQRQLGVDLWSCRRLKFDYNISPSRYIHTGDAETYRPIAEIVAELDTIEAEARETDTALRKILEQIGV